MYLFSAYQKVVYFKVADLIKFSSILTLAVFLFSLTDLTVTVPAYSYLFGVLVTIIVYYTFFRFNFRDIIKTKAEVNKGMIREMFSYALPIMFSTAAGILFSSSDMILLTYLKGPELVGLYNIALPAITIITLLIGPISYHNKNKKAIVSILNFLYNNFLFLSLPLGLIFFAYPNLIINLLFGSKYLGAVNTLRVFSFFFVFRAVRDINFAIVAGIGKAKERSKVLYYAAAFNIIADLVFIPLFAATGAAFATGLSWVLMSYLTTRIILKEYKPRINIKLQFRVVLSNLIFLLSIFFFKMTFELSSIILEAVLVLSISAVIYLLSLFLFKALTKEKIKLFKKIVFNG